MTILVAPLDVFLLDRGFLAKDFGLRSDSKGFESFGDMVTWLDSGSYPVWEVEEGVNVVASGRRMLFNTERVEEVLVGEEFKILESGIPVIVILVRNLCPSAPQPRDVNLVTGHIYRKKVSLSAKRIL